MQQKFGYCVKCKKDSQPVNVKGVCSECTYKANHNGMSRFEVSKMKEKEKPKKIYRLKRKPLKRTKIKQKQKKSTGEYELFLEIWKEREHTCTNCKDNLDRFVDEEIGNPSPILFSHIKSKGSCPELRLDKSNIELLCPTCHHIWEFSSKEKFYERKR